MFLTAPNYDLNDFLSACDFITPPGVSMTYIITPKPMNLPQGSEAIIQQPQDLPEDESITYYLTPPNQKQDQGVTPVEYSAWNPGDLSRRIPVPSVLPDITDPMDLDCPYTKMLNESALFGTDMMLREDWRMFPKNTLFHFEPLKLKESR